jgi:hypothetical protein
MTSAAFEEIQMDEDDVKPTNDTLENNSNLNESMVSNDADDEDDEKPPVSSSSLMQPIDDDSNNQLPLVFVRESLTLCDLHRRVAQDAQLCARFAEIRCSDANCEAIAFVARADGQSSGVVGQFAAQVAAHSVSLRCAGSRARLPCATSAAQTRRTRAQMCISTGHR